MFLDLTINYKNQLTEYHRKKYLPYWDVKLSVLSHSKMCYRN